MNSRAQLADADNSTLAQASNWEGQYRDLLNEINAQERQWQKIEALLKKLVRRLALLAGGHEGGLQLQLDAISEAVRQELDEDALQRHLSGLPLSVPPRSFAPTDPVGPVEAVESARESGTEEVGQAERERVVQSVCSWASATLERLCAVSANDYGFVDLKAVFGEQLQLDALAPALDRLGDHVALHIQDLSTERTSIQKLLVQVEMRLGEMQQFVGSSQASLRSAADNRETLERGVSEEVDAINGELISSDDMGDLRERVRLRLDSVSTQFETFKGEEERRHQQDYDRIEQLSERIQDLEEETKALRNKTRLTEEQLARDELTRVSSRSAYITRLSELHNEWLETGAPLSYAICDIDHFKGINDRFGHAVGDLALKAFAQIGQGEMADADMFARIGGEEFAVLMPNTSLGDAIVRMEKIRETVERAKFHAHGETIPITVSIGVTEFRDKDETDVVYRRADEALYRAKSEGRNRVLS